MAAGNIDWLGSLTCPVENWGRPGPAGGGRKDWVGLDVPRGTSLKLKPVSQNVPRGTFTVIR